MSKVITVPRGDFILVPRKKYQELLRRRQFVVPIAKLTPMEKRAIERSKKEFQRGEYVTLEKLEYELGSPRAKTR